MVAVYTVRVVAVYTVRVVAVCTTCVVAVYTACVVAVYTVYMLVLRYPEPDLANTTPITVSLDALSAAA